jgi:hypothetical protein
MAPGVSSAAPADPKGFVAARNALERGEVARAKGDLEAAHREIDLGIAALGDDYAPDGVDDDTSLKLHAAADLWKEGRRDDAVSTQTNMLRIRLDLYRKKHRDAPAEPRKLVLEIALDKKKSKPTEPLELTLTLKSTGSAPVLVNSRLALNHRDAPDAMREIVLDVNGPDGKPRAFQVKLKIGSASANQVRELKPSESIQSKYGLDKYFDLAAKGDYTVTGFYSSAPLADTQGRPVWTESVTSEELRFTREP